MLGAYPNLIAEVASKLRNEGITLPVRVFMARNRCSNSPSKNQIPISSEGFFNAEKACLRRIDPSIRNVRRRKAGSIERWGACDFLGGMKFPFSGSSSEKLILGKSTGFFGVVLLGKMERANFNGELRRRADSVPARSSHGQVGGSWRISLNHRKTVDFAGPGGNPSSIRSILCSSHFSMAELVVGNVVFVTNMSANSISR